MTSTPEYTDLLTAHDALDKEQVRAQSRVAAAMRALEDAIRYEIDVTTRRAESVEALRSADRERFHV